MDTLAGKPSSALNLNTKIRNHYEYKALHYLKYVIAAAALVAFRATISWWVARTVLLSTYVFWLVLKARTTRNPHFSPRKRKFSFLNINVWNQETSNLSVDKAVLDLPAISESLAISQSFARITDLILKEFVDLWFSKVSADTLFQDSVKVELKHVFNSLSARLAAVDVPTVLVHRIIPILTEHYSQFVTSASRSHDPSYSIENKLSMALEFGNNKIHEGVSLAVPATGVRMKEKRYLRKKVQAILPFLLSPQESSNTLVTTLLTEIIACTVLTSMFSVLSEGDFFNQMVVKVIGSNLQHRHQVKQLREALQQHTTQTPEQTLCVNDTLKLPSLKSPISADCVTAWKVQIARCGSPDGRKYFSEVLSHEQDLLDPSSGAYQCDLAVIKKLLTMVHHTGEVSTRAPSSKLESVLAEPKHAAVFREFLRGSKHESELDIWKDIEWMRAPLEGTETAEVPLLLEFSNKDDIIKIYEKYFHMPELEISELVRTPVALYVNSDMRGDATTLYQQARQALFELQSDVFMHMENNHFREFQNSTRFGDLVVSLPKKRSHTRVTSASFPRNKNLREEDVFHNQESYLHSSVSPVVIKAVESAFEKIMNTSAIEQESKLHALIHPLGSLEFSSTLSHKPLQASLFGDSNASVDMSAFGSHNSSLNRLLALFESNSDSDSDSNSVLSDSLVDSDLSASHEMSNLELLLAAPGDLSLAEKIGVLDQDIENLLDQNAILVSLLKKAELTNNVAELKILRRSNASLEKEIASKELQKQQYIVQENDNSLYGKSKVKIQLCVFGKDENLTYVMYVIEVQKYSSEDSNEIVAGWIVARRYSQFYKLHEYLKKKYPEVNRVKFPKKNVSYLKFQKAQQIEKRKPILEKYLQDLLDLPDVCSDPAFRSFLSSENFHVGKKNIDSVFNRDLGKEPHIKKAETTPHAGRNEEMLQNIKEMERELKQFDEVQKNVAEHVPFVKPISDLLLTVFDLSRSNWLRGRALLVILQQLLGSTIERTITSQVNLHLRQERTVVDILGLLENMLFPNGKFRESPELRTKAEQLATRKEAYSVLQVFMSETCAKIFGVKNTVQACGNMLEMFQNDYLNEHVLFAVLDEVLLVVFPEIGEGPSVEV